MKDTVIMVDKAPVKFTPDGKVNVLDAIGLLCADKDSRAIWRHLLHEHPEIKENSEFYTFSQDYSACVTDGDGWEKIQSALFDLMLDMELQ